MRLLLTSAGITNTSIHHALVDLLAKPIAESSALCIPTASHANPDAERWAAGMPVPCYAIDDQTAIKVTDGAVEVVSEGHWKLFTPRTPGPATEMGALQSLNTRHLVAEERSGSDDHDHGYSSC